MITNKSEFKRKWKTLSEDDKKALKSYYEGLFWNALTKETIRQAEKRLCWIREAER